MTSTTAVPLGEIADFINGDRGKNYPSKSSFIDEGIPFINAGHLQGGEISFDGMNFISESRFEKLGSGKTKPNDLLYCLRGSLGKTAIVKHRGPAAIASSLVIIRPQKELSVNYLFRYLTSPNGVAEIKKFDNGSSQPNLSATSVKKYEIPLPSLTEQKRIAAILDAADALRAKRRETIAQLDTLLQSTFLDMFGDPMTNPMGWQVMSSANLFSTNPRIGTTKPAKGTGLLVVRVGELGAKRIEFEECGRVEVSEEEYEKFKLIEGDTVIARAIGSKNQLGKASFFDGYHEPVLIDSHVMRLRPNNQICCPLWFFSLLSSDLGKLILQRAGGATAVQFNINSKQAASLRIPLPPLARQEEFSEAARKMTLQVKLNVEHLAELNTLFASLQQRAFNGTL